MKWLKIDYIKQHSRIEYDCEDSILELYANAAEDTLLSYINRSYQDLIESYGEVPPAIKQASLMLVDVSYTNRSPVGQTNLSIIPYTFDVLVKPYMRLTDVDDDGIEMQMVTLGSEIKILVSATLPNGLKMQDVDFNVTVYNDDKKDKQKTFAKDECILTEDGDYVVLIDTGELGVGTYMVKATFYIPDTDFPTDYRKEVVRINPNVKVNG